MRFAAATPSVAVSEGAVLADALGERRFGALCCAVVLRIGGRDVRAGMVGGEERKGGEVGGAGAKVGLAV